MKQKIKSLRLSLFLTPMILLNFGVTVNKNVLAATSLKGQEEKATWVTYTTSGEEFSVSMPELPGVSRSTTCLDLTCRIKRVDNTFAAYSNGVVYFVRSYQNPHARQSLDEIIVESLGYIDRNSIDTVKSDVSVNNFKGKKFISVSKSALGFDILSAYYLTDNHVYEVRAIGGSRNDSGILEFFNSFALGGKKGTEIGAGGQNSASPIATPASPTNDAQNRKDTQPDVSEAELVKINKPSEVTHKATVILKPSPEYTEEARNNQLSGTVTLQMVFTSSGKVTNIRTISGLPFGLTEKAIGAARKIYFLPAVIDGKRVNQWIRVEYNFHIY